MLAASCVLACAPAALAQGQGFPNRPVKIIVPQTPGGASDALARIVGQKLSERWGQPVVIENRAGAGGNIGMDAVAKAPGDGYTLLMSYVGSHAINPSIYKQLPFDPERDFVAVGTLANVPFVAAVNAKVPVGDAKALAALAGQRPVAFGSAGNGSVNHLLGEMLNSTAGIDLQHVPYKGVAPAMTDVIGGQVPMAFASLPSVLSHLKSGKLVALGVSSAQRSPALPEVPAIAEKVPGYSGTLWVGLFAPRGIPTDVEARLQQALAKALAQPETRAQLAAQGVELAANGSAAALAALLQEDLVRWARLVKSSGAQVD